MYAIAVRKLMVFLFGRRRRLYSLFTLLLLLLFDPDLDLDLRFVTAILDSIVLEPAEFGIYIGS